jgi:HAE1 family hydrophobic/amphiphilic exporter-1
MKLIENAINYRVSTAVGVLLVVLFGGISLWRIPVQLIPTVERPEIRIQTQWPGALPAEVERQIVQEQEEQLKSLEGLEEIQSVSNYGQAQINLTFQIGTDVNRALLDVSNRLQQVQRHPEDALKPRVQAASTEDQAIAWFGLSYLDADAENEPIEYKRDFLDDVIAPALERVPGVSATNIFGGVRHEMHFYADPVKLATRKLTIAQVAAALSAENVSASGGDFDEGKINYSVRTAGEYTSPEDIEQVVVGYRNGVAILAGDVGYAQLGFEKKRVAGFIKGQETVAINVAKAPGANLLEVMASVKDAVRRINTEVANPQGLELEQLTDSTEYIDAAIELLTSAVYVGAGLAVLVLLFFLRSFTSTLIIAIAMPISVIGTFIVMDLAGRSFNVISLAGLAFAIGMVVDNSIVALENIYRHRQMGKGAAQAARDGAREVWGAILASTLTTVAVFLPVIFIEGEAGQLFRDIAIAISASVTLSMIVAITVIPALSSKFSGRRLAKAEQKEGLISRLSGKATRGIAGLAYWVCGGTLRRIAVVAGFTGAAFFGSLQLTPQVEYLPAGNANFIFGNISLPSNYSLSTTESLSDYFDAALAPLKDCGAEDLECPGGGYSTYFFVSFGTNVFFGVAANDPLRVLELVPVLRAAAASMPGAIGGFRQESLFQRGPSGGAIDLDIVGPDFDQLQPISQVVLAKLQEEVPAAQARPVGSIDRGKPEVRIHPHRLRASQLGLDARDLGVTVNALVDGAKISDYQWLGKRIDLKLIADENWKHRTQSVGNLPVVARDGQLVTLDTVATVGLTSAPSSITHRERQRASTLRITPPPGQPLQQVMEDISAKVIAPLTADGVLGGPYRIIPRGSADKLTETWESLNFNLLFAVVITYLLMAALFQSFGYPFVILLSVPVAGFGGLLGLNLINRVSYQPLDVLTMLGFFILVGTVVNNAILIVHQALNHMRDDGMPHREAIRESTRTRIRPIFMSVMTSVFGMLPLVLFPGAGSELYRGIGSVVVGGLLVSTLLTLVLVPAMFSLFLSAKTSLSRGLGLSAGYREPVEALEGD